MTMHAAVIETGCEFVRHSLADPEFPPVLASAIRAAEIVVHLVDDETDDEVYITSDDLPRAIRQARTILHGRRCRWNLFTGDALRAVGLEELGPRVPVDGIGRA